MLENLNRKQPTDVTIEKDQEIKIEFRKNPKLNFTVIGSGSECDSFFVTLGAEDKELTLNVTVKMGDDDFPVIGRENN